MISWLVAQSSELKSKRVPRWCRVHSSRPVARLMTLARPACASSLAGFRRAIVSLGSGLTANRINLPYASELYPAFNISSSFSSTSALL